MLSKCRVNVFAILVFLILPPSPSTWAKSQNNPKKSPSKHPTEEVKNTIQKKDTTSIDFPAELLNRSLIERNPDFYIAPEVVLEKFRKNEVILVDVRGKDDFNKFRIPGAISIPAFGIKNNPLLKSKNLILTNEGYCYTHLERECKSLKEAGFTVLILDGGLNAWRRIGGPIEGEVFPQDELNKVPPQAFFEEKNYKHWIVINISQSSAQDLIPGVVSIPSSKDSKSFLSAINKVVRENKNDQFSSILIATQNGDGYDQIETLIRHIQFGNIFFLKGGIEGYEDFLKDQILVWKHGKTGTIKTNRCARCP